MTWQSPSEAIRHGACAICLGDGITFQADLGHTAPCTGCGGTGVLDDMLSRQCDDPNCPDHGNPRHLHAVPPA